MCDILPVYADTCMLTLLLIVSKVAVPGGSAVTTQFAELFNATPGDAATLQAEVQAATPGGELAYNIDHMKKRIIG